MAEKKKILSGIYNYTFLGIILAAALLLNIISSFVYKRFDMTEDQRYSLANGTVDFLKNSENCRLSIPTLAGKLSSLKLRRRQP